MNSAIQTGWVIPPTETGGLDHLGVQAPCIQIYGQLLPGITNVTDRARYYSFYLWLYAEFEKKGWRSQDKIIEEIRKADCLFSMIAIRHGQLHGNTKLHAGSSVGGNTLTNVVLSLDENSKVRLSAFTHLEDNQPNRYFKNKFGGLGQYYFGVLQELRLMTGESLSHAKLINKTGEVIAAAMSQGVAGDLFIQVLQGDLVTQTLLDKLSSFCHCQLVNSPAEKKLLISLMRNGWTSLLDKQDEVDVVDTNDSMIRAKSLAIMLLLAQKSADSTSSFDVLAFRGMGYAFADHLGETISYSDNLVDVARSWQVYQRNEVLSIAMQGLFSAVLRSADLHSEVFDSTQAMCHWFWNTGPGKQVLNTHNNVSLLELLQNRCNQLPNFTAWQSEEHEIQLCEQIVFTTHQSSLKMADLSVLTEQCLDVLGAICCREENAAGYDTVQFRQGYLDPYPVNLNSVPATVKLSLNQVPLLEALVKLTTHFCLDSHIRVAMRKLRQQGTNTSRFEKTENGIVIKDIPPATHTSPRFYQSLQILQDMGLLIDEGNLLKPSAEGLSFIKAVS